MATTTLTPAASRSMSSLYAWLTTTDHKKIGILYIANSFLFFFIGGLLALGVRTELAQPGLQFVTPATYNELFTMHATFMIFLFVIPMLAGFGNYVVPLQIGRRTWLSRGSTRCRSGCFRSAASCCCSAS